MDFTSEEYFKLNEILMNELISVENLLVVISEKLYSIGLLSIKNEFNSYLCLSFLFMNSFQMTCNVLGIGGLELTSGPITRI